MESAVGPVEQHSGVETAPSVALPLRLLPFRSLRLAPGRLGDPASARAFARPYRQVAQRLADWESLGQISRDAEPAIYIHEYTSAGLTVRGIVGALDVSQLTLDQREAAVLPHEIVHPAQVRELANRMAAMSVNPAPILLAHEGPALVRELIAEVTSAEPLAAYTDRGGQHHRFWSLSDPAQWHRLNQALAASQAIIADGHHRYAAYLDLQTRQPGTAWDRGLAMLVDQSDTPLFLGAIHRVLMGADMTALLEALQAHGAVEETAQSTALAGLGGSTLALTDGERWWRATLDGRGTAVELLHHHVMPMIRTKRKRLLHVHSMQEAMQQLEQGEGVVLLLPAISFSDVDRVVSAGGLLPEKATSFQPKPTVGSIMRSLTDEDLPSD